MGRPESAVPAARTQPSMETGMNYIAPRAEPLIRDITEGYAADWTMEQLGCAAQRIADRIDELTLASGPAHETASQTAFRSFAGSASSS